MVPERSRRFALAVLLALIVYTYGLTRVGMLGPDEPRYAEIGRQMAQSGDWITPRLWGEPWFEKPVLLYWLTGVAFKLGLGPDLSPRIGVALISIAFLAFLFRSVAKLFDDTVALYATGILGTSA